MAAVVAIDWQGRSEDELPEQVLGNMRVSYLVQAAAVEPPSEEYS